MESKWSYTEDIRGSVPKILSVLRFQFLDYDYK